MPVPNVVTSGVGFRHCQILRLDAYTNLYNSGTQGYAGVTVSYARALTVNDPEPRQIVHVGDDRPFALDVLPPTEPMSGELRVAATNDNVDTVIQNVNDVTIGEAKMYPLGTDKRGSENQVAVLAYRQSLDVDPASSTYGKRLWQWRLFPCTYILPRENEWNENAEERSYSFRPGFVTKYPWGVSLSTSTEGCSQAQGFRGVSEYKPALAAFVTNGVTTSFTLPTNAQSTSKIAAWTINSTGGGTVAAPDTKAVGSVAFTTAPTTGSLVLFYETA